MTKRGRRSIAFILAVCFTAFGPGGVLCAGAAGAEQIPEAGAEHASRAGEAEMKGIPDIRETEGLEPDVSGEAPGGAQESKKRVYLDIDSRYVYEGMEESFSEGYRPKVKDGVLHLVIPFTASGELFGNRLTVCLSFPETAASPFLIGNYQKTVERKHYVLQSGTMACMETAEGQRENQAGEADTYLYSLEVPLFKTAAAGQYAVTVRAFGYTEQMEQVFLERQIFLSLAESEVPGTQGENNGNGTGGQNGGGNDGTGDQTGDGEDKAGDPAEGGENGAGDPAGEGEGSAPAEELIRQPKLLLERGDFLEKEYAAGSEAHVSVTLKNYSSVQPLYNLKVTVSAENQGVRFSKNSFYVPSAKPGESVILETDLRIAADAAEGASPLVFEFEYEDKTGAAVSGRETAVIAVKQPVKLEFSTEGLPGILYASDTAELSLKACNVGRSQVFNVRASLSADGLSPVGEVFLGNLPAGTEGEGTMRIYAGSLSGAASENGSGEQEGEKYGPVSGTLTFQYEDAEGKTYEETKSFQTEIKKAQIVSFSVDDAAETNSWWVSVAAAAFLGLSLWILLLLFRLRRKNALLAEAALAGASGEEGKLCKKK